MIPRFVIVGAGAIGGTLAVQLHRAGHHVEIVARGPHLAAIRNRGLTRVAPDGTSTSRVVARSHISEVVLTEDTVVVIATKVHQAEPVLDDLLAHGGPEVAVACAQNGVEGERLTLRRFRHVYGVLVNVPAVHLSAGEVRVYATAPRGLLDIGCYPGGIDDRAVAIAEAWSAAELLSEACEDIMSRKWSKLIGNVGNATEVLFGPAGPTPSEDLQSLRHMLYAEALAVVEAAGISPDRETQQHRASLVAREDIGEERRPGGSTWQSATRGTGNVETTALNGEICLLGRLYGVPTPANELIQTATLALVAEAGEVGRHTVTDLLARLDA